MNQTLPLHEIVAILILGMLLVVFAQHLDNQHQQNMQVEPHLTIDDFLH